MVRGPQCCLVVYGEPVKGGQAECRLAAPPGLEVGTLPAVETLE